MNKRKACKIAGLKYPASDNVKNRKSTIARAMASTLAPRIPCSPEMDEKWQKIFCDKDDGLNCAYCGAKATHLDHLFPLIKDEFPTGYGTEPGNLVPCCSKCNSKKRNMGWKHYMDSESCEHIDEGKEDRKNRIRRLIEEFNLNPTNWNEVKGFREAWFDAINKCKEALNVAQTVAEDSKKKVYG